MTKFNETYKKMVADNQELFDQFQRIHDRYRLDKQTHQKEFNEVGAKILDIIREYEDRLCAGMERGVYGKYSNKVSEKFWGVIKKSYPLIELVGAQILHV